MNMIRDLYAQLADFLSSKGAAEGAAYLFLLLAIGSGFIILSYLKDLIFPDDKVGPEGKTRYRVDRLINAGCQALLFVVVLYFADYFWLKAGG